MHAMNPPTDGVTGRDARGRFAPGNRLGRGNPHARQTAAWREALVTAVTPANIATVIKRLVTAAEAGEPWAIRELLDRCLGKPHQALTVEGVETPTKTYINVDVKRITGEVLAKEEQE